MRATISDRDFEQISAYLDGQLSAGDQRKLEQRLKSRPELSTALEELKRTRTLIRMAPRRHAPRNFTLTPAMVGDRGVRRTPWSIPGLFPALSFASGLATLILIASIVFELLPGLGMRPTALAPVQKEVAMQPMAASPAQENSNRVQNQGDGAPAMPTATAELTAPRAALAPAPTAVPNLPTPQALETQETAPAAKSAPGPMAINPPVVNWGGSPMNIQAGGGNGNNPSMNVPGNYASPPGAYGKGGGGGPEMGGQGQGYASPNGAIIVPYEGSGTNSAMPPTPAEPTSQNRSQPGGPILGIPPSDQSGQIIGQSAWGQPESSDHDVETGREIQPAAGPSLTSRLSSYRTTQIFAGVLAIMTGLAAYFLWKRDRK